MKTAQEQLRIPAIALLVNAGGAILLHLVSLVAAAMGLALGASNVLPDTDLTWMMANGALSVASSITGIGVCAYVGWSALEMLRLRNYTHAMVGALLACIPCFTFMCCVTSLPFSIWSFVILLRDDVRTAFA